MEIRKDLGDLLDQITLDGLIRFEIHDENGVIIKRPNDYETPWIDRYIKDFFTELNYVLINTNENQKRDFSKALLSTVNQFFEYQDQYFFKPITDEVETLFFKLFKKYLDDNPLDLLNQFEQLKRDAATKGGKYVEEIKKGIIKACGMNEVQKTQKPTKANKPKLTFEDCFKNKDDIKITLQAMRYFQITDKEDQYLEPLNKQKQKLLGFITALQVQGKLVGVSRDLLYKCFCEKIGRPYKRINRPSIKDDSAFIRTRDEMDEYIMNTYHI